MLIPKVLFFDLDNTLIDHHSAVTGGLRAAWEHFYDDYFPGTEFDALKDRFHLINEELWQRYTSGVLTPADLKRIRTEKLIHWANQHNAGTLEANPADVERLTSFYLERYISETIAFEGVHQMLDRLIEREHILGIITNGFTEVQRRKLGLANLTQHFQHVIYSEEIGVHKPDPVIFHAALASAEAQPNEALYIGDNFFHDICGAASVGISTVWYNNTKAPTPESESGVQPDAIAHSIPELAAILGTGYLNKQRTERDI